MSKALPGPALLNPSTTGVVKAATVSRGVPLPPGRDPASWWGRECGLSGVEEAMWDTIKKLYPDDPWSGGVYVKVGSRLMIRSNVDIESGLVNGALCTVTSKGKRGLDGDEMSIRVCVWYRYNLGWALSL